MLKEQILHHRRSIRLADYDYSAEGGYYITIVTQGRVCLFGEVIDGIVQLNEFGKIVWEEWYRTAKLRPNVELMEDEFVVMPNHVHGIIWLNDLPGRGAARCALTGGQYGVMNPDSLPVIVRAFKSAATNRINLLRGSPGVSIWQRNYYEHVISSERDYDNIANYIYSNPFNWDADAENQKG